MIDNLFLKIKRWFYKRRHLDMIADDDLSELFISNCDVPVVINVYKTITHPHEDVSIAAVRKNWLAIAYVKEQTEAICWAALKQDRRALAYIKMPTEEMLNE